jgi:Leucine-rich repeat (LRR) protein
MLKNIVKNMEYYINPENINNEIPQYVTTIVCVGITELPQTMKYLMNVKKITVQSLSTIYDVGGISYIPDFIENYKNLEDLILYSNKIKIIPDFIGNLKKLRTLIVSSNHIEYLPESLSELNNLETLGFSYNKIKKFPDSLSNLHKLKNLYCICNSYENDIYNQILFDENREIVFDAQYIFKRLQDEFVIPNNNNNFILK